MVFEMNYFDQTASERAVESRLRWTVAANGCAVVASATVAFILLVRICFPVDRLIQISAVLLLSLS